MLARSVDPALEGIRSQDAEVRDVAGFYKDHSPSNSGLAAALLDTGLSKMASPTAEVDTDLAVGRGLWTLGGGRWTGCAESTALHVRSSLFWVYWHAFRRGRRGAGEMTVLLT